MKQSNKSGARIVQALSLLLLMIPVLYIVRGTGIISNIGYEDVYWERARYLLGQGGATLYDGSSLCSLGYSLVLVPICAVFKSPYAAYKAAVLLNGIFLCGSYVMSVMAARRLFPKEKDSFLSAACFFAAISPVLSVAKSFTGPKMIVLFLIWTSVYCFASLYQEYRKNEMILLGVCLILIPFFQISLLGFVLAIVTALGILVSRKKIEEAAWLKLILAVLIGIALGNIAERFVLHGFIDASDLEIVPASSLEVYLDGLRAGWKNGYISGFFSALMGKMYILLVNSLLVICPAVWFYIKKHGWKLRESTDIIFYVFVAQLIMMGLFDTSRGVSVGLTSLSGLDVCTPLMLLAGVVYVRNAKNLSKETVGYLLLVCVSAIVTAGVYQKNHVSQFSNTNNGILLLFQNRGMNAVASVYCAACLMILAALFFTVCICAGTKKQKVNDILKIAGAGGCVCISLALGLLVYRHTAMKFSNESLRTTAPVAGVLAELGEKKDVYYYASGQNSEELAVLQSLLPQQKIRVVESKKKDQNEFFDVAEDSKKTVIISRTGKKVTEGTFSEKLSDYRMVYTTEYYAVWARQESEVRTELDEVVSRRMEELALHSTVDTDMNETLSDEEVEELESEVQAEETETAAADGEELSQTESMQEEKKVLSKTMTFGKKVMLAPGTYRMEIYFGNAKDLSEKTGEIRLFHDKGTLVIKKINEAVLNNGSGMVSVEFSSADIMRNFKVQIKGSIVSNIDVEHIYYWKTSSAYTVGLNGGNITNPACELIRELDEGMQKKGTVAYIASSTQKTEDLSVRCFEEHLPEYEVQIISKDEASSVQVDYLIGVTSSHSYYEAMEQYSVIQRGKYYTVLVRNESDAYSKFLKSGGKLLSQDRMLVAEAFTGDDKLYTEQKEDKDTVEIEAGSYFYYLDVVQLTRNILPHGEIGGVQFYDEGEERLLARHTIEDTDILWDEDGKTYLRIPLVLREKCSSLSCTLETGSDIKMEYSLRGIELTAEKYQFGQEEPDIWKLCEIVNAVTEAEKLFVVQTLDEINEAENGFSYLEEKMPGVQVKQITYDEANSTLTDAFLLTRGLSENYLRLIGKYNIIGQAGQYTLLVRSEGTLAQMAEQQGYHALNNGRKVTFESLALTSGVSEKVGTVVKLPKAVYNTTLKLSADEIEADDTVEVYLMCDKSEKAIEKEIKERVEQGYTKKEAKKEVDMQTECAQATYEGYRFEDDGNIVITMKTDKERTLENLTVDAFSWHGCEVEGEILWVEIA